MLADELGYEFGRALTADVAPEELPFYDELVSANQRPTRARQDRSLGFGAEEVLISAISIFLSEVGEKIALFIWQQVQIMAANLSKDAAADLEKRLAEAIRSWIGARFSGSRPVQIPANTAQDLLQTIRQDAVAKGISEPELGKLMSTLSKALT